MPIPQPISRRAFGAVATGGAAVLIAPRATRADQSDTPGEPPGRLTVHEPELARQIVGASHFDLDRVKTLVERRPEFAKASIDWGFGDWETALGAASHTGQREIAQVLLANGARTNVFTAAMLGQLDFVRAAIEANPGLQRTRGPHGITLLRHAKAGRESAERVVAYLESLGDADPAYTNIALSSSDIDAITGEYGYGAGSGDRFSIVHEREMIRLKREGDPARNLFHQGGFEFHPAGAPSVRIRFAVADGVAKSATINLGDPPIVARRVG